MVLTTETTQSYYLGRCHIYFHAISEIIILLVKDISITYVCFAVVITEILQYTDGGNVCGVQKLEKQHFNTSESVPAWTCTFTGSHLGDMSVSSCPFRVVITAV